MDSRLSLIIQRNKPEKGDCLSLIATLVNYFISISVLFNAQDSICFNYTVEEIKNDTAIHNNFSSFVTFLNKHYKMFLCYQILSNEKFCLEMKNAKKCSEEMKQELCKLFIPECIDGVLVSEEKVNYIFASIEKLFFFLYGCSTSMTELEIPPIGSIAYVYATKRLYYQFVGEFFRTTENPDRRHIDLWIKDSFSKYPEKRYGFGCFLEYMTNNIRNFFTDCGNNQNRFQKRDEFFTNILKDPWYYVDIVLGGKYNPDMVRVLYLENTKLQKFFLYYRSVKTVKYLNTLGHNNIVINFENIFYVLEAIEFHKKYLSLVNPEPKSINKCYKQLSNIFKHKNEHVGLSDNAKEIYLNFETESIAVKISSLCCYAKIPPVLANKLIEFF
jgi:hypothetical protein